MSVRGWAAAKKYIEDRGAVVRIERPQQMRFINLHLTDRCNLRCFGCNRYCDSAPSTEHLTVEQVRRFVDESLNYGWPWVELRLAGGEPLLHPDLEALVAEVKRLQDHIPGMVVKLLTNGKVKDWQRRLNFVPDSFRVVVGSFPGDKGQRIIPEFGNVLQAPVDRLAEIAPDGVIRACEIHSTCGLELTRWGYVPCGCGGPRVYGAEMFFHSLEEVTLAGCYERLRTLCALCGRNLHYTVFCRDSTEASPFWRDALEAYKANPPELPIYPGDLK